MTDKVQYLPGGIVTGSVSYNGCFHDLPNGLQTHVYAPLGLEIKEKWILGGTLPGEPVQPVELGLGAPLQGLWLREDVDMKCNIVMTGFVKKTLKKAHAHLVDRLVVKAQILDGSAYNARITDKMLKSEASFTDSEASTRYEERRADSESTYSNGSASSGLYSYTGPQNARQQSHNFQNDQTLRALERPDFRDKMTYDQSLVPPGLGIRGSNSSNNSLTENQKLRLSYNGQSNGGQGRVVSWQNLSQRPEPSPNSQQVDPAYQTAIAELE